MKSYDGDKIRNIGLFSHQGAGKTILAEAMLYNAKATDRLGRISDGNTVTDYNPDEIERQISIYMGLAPFEWKNCKINCIDTPGFMDFVAEVKSALRVIEGALFLVSANAGVEVGLEKVWEYAEGYHLARMIFINKMDKENADFYKTFEEAKRILSPHAIPVQIPIGVAEKFTGIVDLVEETAYTFDGGKLKRSDIPKDLEANFKKYREKLMEAVAETDDELLNKYLMEGVVLNSAEIKSGLKKGIASGKIIPVFCGSAYKNIAVLNLMDAVFEYIPTSNTVKLKGFNPKTKNDNDEEIKPLATSFFSALVFKTTADPYVGRLTIMRVFSGKLTSDSVVYNSVKEKDEKIAALMITRGKNQENTGEVLAGDIVTVSKLQATQTGDTLCAKDHPVIYPKIEFPKPVASMAVFPKSKGDEDKLSSGISRLMEEDPTLTVMRNNETKETVISGMGDLHLDISMERLKRRFGVEVNLAIPKVPYKETIKGRSRAEGKYKRQSGGRGQYGHVWLEVEPMDRGGDFEFVDKIVGGAIPRNYIPSVEKGVREAMAGGVVAGYPLVDVRITLYDGSFHEVDSSDMAFKIAGGMALRKCVLEAKPVLLEPIVNLEITIPDSNMGDCIGDLNSKRGKILGMEPADKKGMQTIKSQVPLAEMQKYAIDLRSITQGRGIFNMEFYRYEEVPPQVADQLIAKLKKEEEMKV